MPGISMPVYFLVLCTAYSASLDECGKTDGITASGIRAVEGETIAADDLPFGTKVEIMGKIYTVHDRFGGGYKNRVDIFKESKEDCIRFGRQYAFARIVSKPDDNAGPIFKPLSSSTHERYYF